MDTTTPNYRTLDAQRILATVQRLSLRVGERFPGSSLAAVVLQVLSAAAEAQEEASAIGRPILWLRLFTALLVVLMVGLVVGSLLLVEAPIGSLNLFDYLQVVESLINDAIFIGAAIFFLARREARIKQHRALQALHQLRSLAHVVDMHQLTKDPERLRPRGFLTTSSPPQTLTPFELNRYLDYCSEMLSLIGKIAALYVQEFDDPIVLAAVNEIESLTTGLSRKIWQKLMMVNMSSDSTDSSPSTS